MNGDNDSNNKLSNVHGGTILNSAGDWVWFQAVDGDEPTDRNSQYYKAEEALRIVLGQCRIGNIPFEQVYDPVTYTKNVVIPRDLLTTVIGLRTIFADAGYIEKPIPEPNQDKQQSQEFLEALKSGAQISKKWH